MTEIPEINWAKYDTYIAMNCPNCDEVGHFDHDVAADGLVTRSLDCPTPSCDFHEMVRLDGWIYGQWANPAGAVESAYREGFDDATSETTRDSADDLWPRSNACKQVGG